jgi:hypothetical protein
MDQSPTEPDPDDWIVIQIARSPRFQTMLDRSRQSIREGKCLSENDFWQAVERQRPQE